MTVAPRLASLYHLLKSLPPSPPSLSPTLRVTTLAAGHVAAGDTSAVIAAFAHLPSSGAPLEKAYDLAVLQTTVFVGFPRALTAAAALAQAGVGCPDAPLPVPPLSSTAGAGDEAFAAVYGRAAGKVRRRIAAAHPALEAWMMDHVYGTVLSAPGPSMRERELCAVAALAGAGLGTEPLLVSHMRGALRCGASATELRAIIDQTELVFGEGEAERAEAVWMTYQRARNML